MNKKIIFSFFTLFLPLISSAQNQLKKTSTFFETFLGLVENTFIPLVFVLAIGFFFWGIAKYIWSEGGGKDDGKRIMIWGVVALFVMSTIWGLVQFLRDEIGVGDESAVPIPTATYGA